MDLYSVNTFLLSLQKQLTVNLKEMQLERGGMGLYPSKELKKKKQYSRILPEFYKELYLIICF